MEKKVKAFPIWQPRYHDEKVLISCKKVSDKEDTYIFICGDERYPNLYRIPSNNFYHYEISSNGRISCFEVPLTDLIDEGMLPSYLASKKEKELIKLKNFITNN